MPANDEPYDITSDTQLRDAVYTETQYSKDKHITEDDVDGLIESGKRVLALRADVSDFYGDRGIAVALLGHKGFI